jgi:hypothetical protein
MVGERVNNYVVKSLLGEGGMGSVWLAEHPTIGRRVALKVLRKELCEDPAWVARFVNEARAAHSIRHPNIIDVLDAGTLPSGVPYIIMEYLEGESLAQRLESHGRLTVANTLAIARQTTAALQAAHAAGIIHRDLKPDNLFLVPDAEVPGGERVKVLDFGIAKLTQDLTAGSVRTRTGAVMGTPQYMSPEQCRGVASAVDLRTDIYAMGIILYRMLCGVVPFDGEGFGDVIMLHMAQPPVPPRDHNPEIPEALEAAILKALAKKAEHRFASMAELQAALGSAPADDVLDARPTSRITSARTGATGPAAVRQVMGTQPTAVRPGAGGAITTLSGAAGDLVEPASTPARGGSRKLVLGMAAVVTLGAAGLAFTQRARLSPGTSSASAPSPSPVSPAVRSAAALPPEVPPPAPAIVAPTPVAPPAPVAQPAPAAVTPLPAEKPARAHAHGSAPRTRTITTPDGWTRTVPMTAPARPARR